MENKKQTLKAPRSFIVKVEGSIELKEFLTKKEAISFLANSKKGGFIGPWYFKKGEVVTKTHSSLVIK